MKTLKISFEHGDYAMLQVTDEKQARQTVVLYINNGDNITAITLDGEPYIFRPTESRWRKLWAK